MVGRRIGAIAIAVALIAGALLLRRAVLDDDADASPAGTVATTEPAAAAAELVCITELAAACDAARAEHPELRVTVEDAGATLDRLAALPDGEDAPLWLTIEPYPAMVDSLRSASDLDPLAAETQDVAATKLAVAAPNDGRADALVTACAATPLWRCIGDNAGNEWTDLGGEAAWGRVRPSLGVVDRQAVALASLASAVAGYFGNADIRSSDWQNDPAFTPWMGRLAGAVGESVLSGGTPLGTMAVRASALDLAATTDAEVAALGGDQSVLYPEPSMWAEAVLAVPGGSGAPDDLTATLASAATTAGWDAPGSAQQSLPNESTMLALRTLWQETV